MKIQLKKKKFLYQQHFEQSLNDLIHQYLLKKNYKQTLSSFQKQISHQQKQFKRSLEAEMLQAFHNGNSQFFFSRFQKYTPKVVRKSNLKVLTLQFYLRIHFLIYPINPNVKKKVTVSRMNKKEVQKFKQFIEQNGDNLSKNNQLLIYYSIPFVDNLKEHKYLKQLFTSKWIQELQSQLKNYMFNLYQQGMPKLLYIYKQHIQNVNQHQQSAEINNQLKIKDLQQKLRNKKKQLQKEKLKNKNLMNQEFQKTYEQSQKIWMQQISELIKISIKVNYFNQLIQILNKRNNYPVDLEMILQPMKLRIKSAQQLLNMNQEGFKKRQKQLQNISVYQNSDMFQIKKNKLDIKKMKKTLNTSQISQFDIISIFQIVKQKLLNVQGLESKREIIICIIQYDLISINSKQHINTYFEQLNTIHFINLLLVISLDYYGRNYLSNQYLIQKIINIYNSETNQNIKSQILIELMQKLVVKKKNLLVMLKRGWIRKLIRNVNNQIQSLTQNTLETISQIVAIVGQSTAGMNMYSSHPQQILDFINNLLLYQNENIYSHVFKLIYLVSNIQIFKEIIHWNALDEKLMNLNLSQECSHNRDVILSKLKSNQKIQNKDLQQYDYDDITPQAYGKYQLIQKAQNKNQLIYNNFQIQQYQQKILQKVKQTLKQRNKHIQNIEQKNTKKQQVVHSVKDRPIITSEIGMASIKTVQQNKKYVEFFKPQPKLRRTPPKDQQD